VGSEMCIRDRSMTCIQNSLGEPDERGRRRPVPIEGSEFELACETVIMAIGQGPNPLLTKATPGLELNRRGNIVVTEDSMRTSLEHVYAGGDIVTGAATVILAMGAGKAAAQSISKELSGKA